MDRKVEFEMIWSSKHTGVANGTRPSGGDTTTITSTGSRTVTAVCA